MALPRSDYDTALSVHRWGKNEKDSHFDFVHKLYRFQNEPKPGEPPHPRRPPIGFTSDAQPLAVAFTGSPPSRQYASRPVPAYPPPQPRLRLLGTPPPQQLYIQYPSHPHTPAPHYPQPAPHPRFSSLPQTPAAYYPQPAPPRQPPTPLAVPRLGGVRSSYRPPTSAAFSPRLYTPYIEQAPDALPHYTRPWLALETLQGPSATWLAFSPDSATIAASCCDGTVRLTDTATGDCKAIIEAHPAGWQLHHVTWAPDGTTLAVAAADRSVRLYDVRSQAPKGNLLHSNGCVARCVAISPDGVTLAAALSNGHIKLWDARVRWDAAPSAARATLSGHTNDVNSVAFSPSGLSLASASSDKTVRIWAVDSATCKATATGQDGAVTCVAYRPDGATLVSASYDKSVRLRYANSGGVRSCFLGHRMAVDSAAFSISDGGKSVVSASHDKTALVFDVATGLCRGVLRGHTRQLTCAAFCPSDSGLVATASMDNSVRLWRPPLTLIA